MLVLSLFVFIAQSASAAFTGGVIDATKFKALAQSELAAQGISTAGEVIFQDGATQNFSGEGEDLACLFYVTDVKFLNRFQVVYQLPLNGEPAEIRLVGLAEQARARLANGAITTFPSEVDAAQVDQILKAYQQKYPEVSFSQIGTALSFYADNLKDVGIMEAALKDAVTQYQAKVSPNEYFSINPEIYGKLNVVGEGDADLDALRDVLPQFIQNGIAIETESTVIPVELKPE
jgi:hypothetical protein